MCTRQAPSTPRQYRGHAVVEQHGADPVELAEIVDVDLVQALSVNLE
jgi:hypothetical protein